MNTQFAKLLQIGIIVEDVDAVSKRFEENYGMGPLEHNRIRPRKCSPKC